MKRIIFVKLMLLLTIISISSKAFSQFERGFAGEDVKVYFKLEENQTTKSVNVGKYDSRDNVFYTWEVVSQPDGSILNFSDVFKDSFLSNFSENFAETGMPVINIFSEFIPFKTISFFISEFETK